jgi:NhaP-type Na+/H+ or K+/H+ antiporter
VIFGTRQYSLRLRPSSDRKSRPSSVYTYSSATDPVSTLAVFSAKKVDPQLFYLLSGESLINDAVGLVLFEAFAHLVELESDKGSALALGEEILSVLLDVFLNFGGSLILGVFLGLLAAFALKKIDLRHTPILELSAYSLIMYAPFVLAEICRLSGIVTVLFTGLAARRYAEPNLSKFTRENSDTIFRLVAHMTETVIFLELGLSVITILRHGFDVLFVISALGACLIARAFNIYPLAFGFNVFQRLRLGRPDTKSLPSPSESKSTISDDEEGKNETPYTKSDHEQEVPSEEVETLDDAFIPRRTTHFMFLSGLRGAVSYGLVKMFPDNNGNKVTFEVTTMLIVLITTFVFGGFTDFALKKLEIPVGVDEDTYMKSLKRAAGEKTTSWWSRFERKRISPFLLRDFTPPSENTGDEFLYQEQVETIEITVEEAAEKLRRKKESIYDFGHSRSLPMSSSGGDRL